MPNKIVAWVMTHKPIAAGAGAVGAAGGVVILRRRKANAHAVSTTAGVPADATTAASVMPYGGSDGTGYGGNVAGGVPYDPSGFDTDASTYLATISQQISDLQQSSDARPPAGTVGPGGVIHGVPPHKPDTGGKMTAPPRSAKPKKKPHKPHPVTQQPRPEKKPPPRRKRVPPPKKATPVQHPRRPKMSKQTRAAAKKIPARRWS